MKGITIKRSLMKRTFTPPNRKEPLTIILNGVKTTFAPYGYSGLTGTVQEQPRQELDFSEFSNTEEIGEGCFKKRKYNGAE